MFDRDPVREKASSANRQLPDTFASMGMVMPSSFRPSLEPMVSQAFFERERMKPEEQFRSRWWDFFKRPIARILKITRFY